MPRSLLLLLLFAAIAHADELTKSVQSALKDQGFFYGEATGVGSPETIAAVKRYQIRNGLEVTGTLTKETLTALGIGGEPPATSPAPPPVKPAQQIEPTPAPRPPVDLRKDNTAQEKDREFLRRQQTPPADVDTPSRTPATAGGPYARWFAGTPYTSAPQEVQQDTIRKAQSFLRNLDFYHERLDGVPGPALEEGILSYQDFIALPLTGKLDLETLAAMRLLPGRGGAPAQSANPKVRTVPGTPLKGIWIK